MNPRISEREILEPKIRLLLFGKSGITPKSKQEEILTDKIIELIGKTIDECKTIEEVKEIFKSKT